MTYGTSGGFAILVVRIIRGVSDPDHGNFLRIACPGQIVV